VNVRACLGESIALAALLIVAPGLDTSLITRRFSSATFLRVACARC
jgi:hypothetical protein